MRKAGRRSHGFLKRFVLGVFFSFSFKIPILLIVPKEKNHKFFLVNEVNGIGEGMTEGSTGENKLVYAHGRVRVYTLSS